MSEMYQVSENVAKIGLARLWSDLRELQFRPSVLVSLFPTRVLYSLDRTISMPSPPILINLRDIQ